MEGLNDGGTREARFFFRVGLEKFLIFITESMK